MGTRRVIPALDIFKDVKSKSRTGDIMLNLMEQLVEEENNYSREYVDAIILANHTGNHYRNNFVRVPLRAIGRQIRLLRDDNCTKAKTLVSHKNCIKVEGLYYIYIYIYIYIIRYRVYSTGLIQSL